MDPFTGAAALSAAAAITQFIALGMQVGNRIRKFTLSQANLPEALKVAEQRVELLSESLSRIRDEILGNPAAFSQGRSESLGKFVSSVEGRVQQVNSLLANYLPKGDDSTFTEIEKAIKSLGKETKLGELSSLLCQDVTFLTLHWVVLGNATSSNHSSLAYLEGKRFFDISRPVLTFVGRDYLLGRINALFEQQSGKTPRVVVLQGMGGQGKTQIALEYCRRMRQENRFAATFWANSSSVTSLKKSFEGISEYLKAPGEVLLDSTSRINLAKRVLAGWHKPWLMVYDNYDDPVAFRDVADYFPAGQQGHILFTSRSPDTHRVGHLIEVPGMPEADAVKMLLDTAGRDCDETSKNDAKSIVKRLGYLPLAIDQAGSYLRDAIASTPLDGFLSIFESEKQKILTTTPSVWEYLDQTIQGQRDRAKNVFTTWELSYRQLEREDDSGANRASFLMLLGFFHNEGISESLFLTQHLKTSKHDQFPWMTLFLDGNGKWSSLMFETFMSQLKKLSLITSLRKADDGFFQISLHPLVSDWIRLRQIDQFFDIAKQNFHQATLILSNSIVKYYVSVPLLHNTFKISVSTKNGYLSHVLVWIGNLKKFYGKENFNPISIQTIRPRNNFEMHPWYKLTELRTAEECFLHFLNECGLFPQALDLSNWLWHRCSPYRPLGSHVKHIAGVMRVQNAAYLGNYKEAERVGVQNVEFWALLLEHTELPLVETRYHLAVCRSSNKASVAHDSIRRGKISAYVEVAFWEAFSESTELFLSQNQYLLLACLSATGKRKSHESICEELLLVLTNVDTFTELDPESRRAHDVRLELARNLLAQNAVEKRLRGVGILKDVLAAGKKSGAIQLGSYDWGYRQWTIAIVACEKESFVMEKLALEFVSVAKQQLGVDHEYYYKAKIYLAKALYDNRKFESAEENVLECIKAMEGSTPRQGSDINNLGLLGDILLAREKGIDAEKVCRQSIQTLVERGADYRKTRPFMLKMAEAFTYKETLMNRFWC